MVSHPISSFAFVVKDSKGEHMEHADQLLTTDTAILDEVPLERLETEISSFASRLAAATARWLIWIAAYDRREGWRTWETKSCAHWLNWQCGVAPRTAREHVQIAHKLETFSELRDTFLAGELSYSKVRAIVRVIVPENETDLIHLARQSTASQLERALGKLPDADKDGEDEEAKNDIVFTNNGDGTMTMAVTRRIADMAPAKKSVQKAASDVIAREQNEHETKTDVIDRLGGMKTIRADVATALITGTLDSVRGVEHTVLVVADIDSLSGVDENAESTVDSQRVDAAVVQRLCCDGIIQTALVEGNGVELATGSNQRIVPRRIRRLLERRDHGMCQYPGCESEHRLHAHHVIHWAKGGPTELWNLVSLCDFHHHSVHEGGWNVTASTNGWTFHDPNGNRYQVPILRLPTATPLPATTAAPIPGTAAPLAGTGERADLDYIADTLMRNTERRKQRLDLT